MLLRQQSMDPADFFGSHLPLRCRVTCSNRAQFHRAIVAALDVRMSFVARNQQECTRLTGSERADAEHFSAIVNLLDFHKRQIDTRRHKDVEVYHRAVLPHKGAGYTIARKGLPGYLEASGNAERAALTVA